MKPAMTSTKTFVNCPACNAAAGAIDHLLAPNMIGRIWGPWHCESCNAAYRVRVTMGMDLLVETEVVKNAKAYIPHYVLLELPPQDKSVFVVLRTRLFENEDGDHSFFFNEHSCPTNWLRDINKLIIEDDQDPHGLLEFRRAVVVATVPDTALDQSTSGGQHKEHDMLQVFPEIDKRPIEPAVPIF